MTLLRNTPFAVVIAFVSATATASAERTIEPLRFFEGTTESFSTVNVLMRRPYHSRTVGRGRIDQNGSLILVQRVEDEGKKPFERRWLIRQVGPGRFVGTMSDAAGPVAVTQSDGRYHFHLKTKGGLNVDQFVTPLPDGKSARTQSTIKKLGIRVATSQGTIRKLD
jgi:hypothetical protein